jgi:minor extracellular serine protease Vpr
MRRRIRYSLILAALMAFPLWGDSVRRTYVVELDGEPMGALARPEMAVTAEARAHRAVLLRQKTALGSLLAAVGAKVVAPLDNALNGLIVSIEEDRVAALRRVPGVRAVYTDCEAIPASDKAMEMNGIPEAWRWLGGRELAGEGVKIAIIDSGIVADHPAFQDMGMKAPPGFPRANTPANLALTNGKVIVARHHTPLASGREPLATETVADATGHGTALAAVAAGTPHQAPYGFLSGIAPKAWLGIYSAASGISIVKSLDAAMEDGMDIVNLSFMFTNGPVEDARSALRAAVDRATRAGMIVVTPTGPLGPQRGTLMDPPLSPDVVTVGGTPNSRLFAGAVRYGAGTAVQAFAGSNRWFTGSLDLPDQVAGNGFDLTAVDATGSACQALPAGSVAGFVVVANYAGCTPEVKLKNLEAAGARGAIFYTANAATAPARFLSGTAALGGVVVGFQDGRALLDAIAKGPVALTVQFDGVAYPLATNMVASDSGRGPTFDHRIKPDLVAVGDPRYVPGQKTNASGMFYSTSGYGTRYPTVTPSFATATVAGALAALMSKRPGLTSDQYRSLIINTASPLIQADGNVARVMDAGAGELNVAAALKSTLAVYPYSLSFGVAAGTISQHRGLSLANLGTAAETYTLRAVSFDGAPALKILDMPSMCPLGDAACVARGTETLTVTVEAGRSATVYPRWHATGLAPGEYQGMILIEGTAGHGVVSVVPYWLGVPSGVPAAVRSHISALLADGMPFAEYYNEPAASAMYPGTEGWLFYLVTDSVGIAIQDAAQLQFQGTVVAGGGRIGAPTPVPGSLGAIRIPVALGPSPGVNTFRFQFGAVAPVTFTVTAVARP